MKKTIMILLIILMLSINSLSQSTSTTRLFGQDVPNDAINHVSLSFIISGAVTAQMYGWTGKK